jgi:Ca-activated chloride channel family protein
MTAGKKRLVFGLLALALTLILVAVYRRFVWSSPETTLSWVRGGTTYVLRSPKLLGLLLISPFFLLVLPRSLADLPWQQQALSLGLRVAFVAALALSLARVARTDRAEKVCTVFLVDVSDSVTAEAIEDARHAIDAALGERRRDDIARLLTFARRPRVVQM